MSITEDLTNSKRLEKWLIALGAKRLGGSLLFPSSDTRMIEFKLNRVALLQARSFRRTGRPLEVEVKDTHCVIKLRPSGIMLTRMIANNIAVKQKHHDPIKFSNSVRGIAIRKESEFELGEPDWLTHTDYKEYRNSDDPNMPNKYRMFFHLKEPDRIVHSIASYYLREAAERILSPACMAYRQGKKFSQIVQNVQDWSQRYRWVFRMDIASFNETVDQSRMISVLRNLVAKWDEEDREILISIVMGMFELVQISGMYAPGRGILPGSPLTPILTNLYLMALDEHFIKMRIGEFIRYGDDIISFHRTRKDVIRVETTSDKFVRNILRQKLNKEPGMGIFRCGKQGFDFVGFRFDGNGIRMREKTYNKIRAKIKRLTQKKSANHEKKSQHKKPFMIGFYYDETGDFQQTLATKYGLINLIKKINRRLGFETHCDPEKLTFPISKSKCISKVTYIGQRGWPQRFINCIPSGALKEQFQSIDSYLKYRCLRFANRLWDDRLGYITIRAKDLRKLGLRTFMDVWNRHGGKVPNNTV